VRATLIPTLAVPVSLIGTFIALLAVGYSANSVSLLAVVLAIGIVVDDAIVVVENVERVMEEHPELTPADATKKAMSEITAPIIAITLVLLSVFVPVAFIPGISGELFRQFAVTVSVSMFLSAINALRYLRWCAILLRPHHGPRKGIMEWSCDRSIVRDAYGVAVARIVRFSVIGLDGGGFRRRYIRFAKLPDGILPEDDQGAFSLSFGCRAVPRWLARQVIKREPSPEDKSVEDVTSVIGLNFIDNYHSQCCLLVH
jgi:multidrug efflux pump subunit AcrB